MNTVCHFKMSARYIILHIQVQRQLLLSEPHIHYEASLRTNTLSAPLSDASDTEHYLLHYYFLCWLFSLALVRGFTLFFLMHLCASVGGRFIVWKQIFIHFYGPRIN